MLPVWLVVTLLYLLKALWWAFLARFIFDIFNPRGMRFKPSGPLLWLLESLYIVTDWLLWPIRKVIKPVRIGSVMIDFSWTIALVLISILQTFVYMLG